MKTKFLVSLIACLTVLALIQTVFASSLNVEIEYVEINGVALTPSDVTAVAGFAGETIPLKVVFTSNVDAKDVRVKAWISGYREDIAKSSRRINLVNGSTYSEILTLSLPSDIDPEEEATLYVRIETKTDNEEAEFKINLQRESYDVEILDIDAPRTANAGENLVVAVVLKNRGYEELEDMFVVASIPELGVQKKSYFEDLTPVDEDDDDDKKDSAERTVYLKIPETAKDGIYEVVVKAYNSDVSETDKVKVVVSGAKEETKVVAPIKSKEIAVGETAEFELTIVNYGSKVGVYEVSADAVGGIVVNVNSPIVTVTAGSSETVKVSVKAVAEGTQSFTVSVTPEGKPSIKANFSAIVTKKAFTGNIAILTIILAIVFVVLLVVLIVLLARKPSKTEELEESYY